MKMVCTMYIFFIRGKMCPKVPPVAEFNSIQSGHIDDVHWSKSSGQGLLFTTLGRGILMGFALYKHTILRGDEESRVLVFIPITQGLDSVAGN